MNEIYVVRVEWMDGETREYTVGGYAVGREAMTEGNGILVLHMGNRQYGPPDHVATIPLANVREYKAVRR